ncbi:hypothetical protein EDD85DRAFT_784115 [Armillaria nabsnona]|nr:hypothetical protein EDD85DRAFT_784115 [Armillaria nabsnona]
MPSNSSPSPSQPLQYLPHRHWCQSPLQTTSAHHNIDISHHLNTGGAIKGRTSYNNDDQHDDSACGDGRALMQDSESIWKKDAGEREDGWRVLEGRQCQGKRWDKDEDANSQRQ